MAVGFDNKRVVSYVSLLKLRSEFSCFYEKTIYHFSLSPIDKHCPYRQSNASHPAIFIDGDFAASA